MAMQKGEVYTCANDDCACQIQVMRSSSATRDSENPRCCCGEQMDLKVSERTRA